MPAAKPVKFTFCLYAVARTGGEDAPRGYLWQSRPKAYQCFKAMEAGLTDHVWPIEEICHCSPERAELAPIQSPFPPFPRWTWPRISPPAKFTVCMLA